IMAMVFLGTILTYKILRSFPFLKMQETITITAAFFIATTISTSIDFGDREHMIVIWLTPFILSQYAITHRYSVSKPIILISLVIGAIFILVKPHYGLLPTAFLIHRMFLQSNFWKILKDADFMILSVATVTYLGALFTIFQDYTFNIFPDVKHLYLHTEYTETLLTNAAIPCALTGILLIMEWMQQDLDKNRKRLIITIYSASLLCFIPYFVQFKGYFNHILPANSFFVIGLGMSLIFRMSVIEKSSIKQIAYTLISITLFANVFYPVHNKILSKNDMKNMPLTHFLESECLKPCTFFAFHDSIEIINPTAAHMGYTHGTRFPSTWFLPKIVHDLKNAKTQGDVDHTHKFKKKYAKYFDEDIKHYEPSILLIGKGFPVSNIENFNFLDFFLDTPEAKKHFKKNYKKTSIFKFNQGDYFKGTSMQKTKMLEYDVYKRINNQSLNTNNAEPK
ncbi:MAG: hypothetical protein KUG67_03595, partial [Proteobacteria bacterium]|nr:hypothetical protein [Pseudomonadota bacterium]